MCVRVCVGVYVCVRLEVSGSILCEQLHQLLHSAQFFFFVIPRRHTNIYCGCNHKYGHCKSYYSYKHSPGGSNNLRQSAECHLALNNSRYLCRETESVVHLPPCWSPAPATRGEWCK